MSTATHRTFNPNDEGSNPSGPTSRFARGSRDLVDQARLIYGQRWVQFPRLPLEKTVETKVLKQFGAAWRILTLLGEGSNPSGLTGNRNPTFKSARGVVATRLPSKQKMRVRFSLGALSEKVK